MRKPSANFVARVIAALPVDGAPMSARAVFLTIGLSTPAYVRLVLTELVRQGRVIATGPGGQRVYRRVFCVPAGGVPVVQGDTVHECA